MSKKTDYAKIIHNELDVPNYLIFEDTKYPHKFRFKTSDNSSLEYFVDFQKKTIVAKLKQDVYNLLDMASNAYATMLYFNNMLTKYDDVLFNELKKAYEVNYRELYQCAFDDANMCFTGKAKCCDEDEFSLESGFEIAKSRALAEAHIFMLNAYNYVSNVYAFMSSFADVKADNNEDLIYKYADKLALYGIMDYFDVADVDTLEDI